MAENQATPSANNVATLEKPQQPRLPPDEKFWKRYSPHHEFPLSTVVSVAIHVVLGVLIVLVFKKFMDMDKKPLPMEPIRLAGGGGNSQGIGPEKGGALPPPVEEADKTPQENVPPSPTPEKDPAIKTAEAKTPELTPEQNDAMARLLARSRTTVQGFDKVNTDTQKKLLDGLRVPGKGQGGEGSGGGK